MDNFGKGCYNKINIYGFYNESVYLEAACLKEMMRMPLSMTLINHSFGTPSLYYKMFGKTVRGIIINIMTVHQSKGLEFAAVFIPQLNKNYFPAQRIDGKGIWHILNRSWITDSARFDGDVEEERKLFYVAVTRAKKYLYLSRSETSRDKYVSEVIDKEDIKRMIDESFYLPYAT
jgi:ATP-dependent helicase/DNAse subunit B